MKFILVIFGFLISPLTFAGSMVSTGNGELLRDSHNPWWVKNVSDVNYCIAVDEKTFSGDAKQVPAIVEKTIQYWRSEFQRQLQLVANAEDYNKYFNEIGVGRQTFHLTPCNGQESLKIQIGYGTLDEKQRKVLTNLEQIVGVTIRTDYSPERLEGKGFIYIASDLGAKKYAGGPDVVDTPWKSNALLFFAIVHEMGHVFGMSHVGSSYTLMSEQFMETLLNKEVAQSLQQFDPLTTPVSPFFFASADLFVHCIPGGFSSEADTYLGMAKSDACLWVSTDGINKRIHLASAADRSSAPKYLGGISALDLKAELQLASTIFLTNQQKVFDPILSAFTVMAGPSFIAQKGSGTFISINGQQRPVHITLRSDRFDLLGFVNGDIKSLIEGDVQLYSSISQNQKSMEIAIKGKADRHL